MLKSGAPWWMYVAAVVFILTFLFNTRQEFWGPASGGWIPEPSLFKVASVLPGGPMDKAGIHSGDVLEAVDGYPLNGAGNWFGRGRTLNGTARPSFRCGAGNNTLR